MKYYTLQILHFMLTGFNVTLGVQWMIANKKTLSETANLFSKNFSVAVKCFLQEYVGTKYKS